MLTWLKSATGLVVLAGIVVLVVLGVFFKDKLLAKLYDQKTVSSEAHGDTAKVEIKAADSIRAAGVPIRNEFLGLTNSPEVRNSPIATKVANSGKKVIANTDAENTRLRNANDQLKKQVNDLETRPDKPIPRTIPYVDIGYSRSFTRQYGVPIFRAGLDYRLPLVSFAKVKLEVSYEPPPAPKPGEPTMKPELRGTVAAHLTF